MIDHNQNLKRTCIIFCVLIFIASLLIATLLTKDFTIGFLVAISTTVLSVLGGFRMIEAQNKDLDEEKIELCNRIKSLESRVKNHKSEDDYYRQKYLDLERLVRNAEGLEDLHLLQQQDTVVCSDESD